MMRLCLTVILCLNSWLVFAVDTLQLHVDAQSKTFTISLPANATTGFQWRVKSYDKTHLKLIHSQYITPKTQRIGAEGQTQFIFSRVKNKAYPKSTQLVFCYSRPWEKNTGIIKQVDVRFRAVE